MDIPDMIGLVLAIILGAFFIYALVQLARLYWHIHQSSKESSTL